MTDSFFETAADTWRYFKDHIERVEQKRKAALFTVAGFFATAWIISMLFFVEMAVTHESHHLISNFIFTLFVSALPTFYVYRTLRRGVWLAYKPLSHLIAKRIIGPAYRAWGIIEAEELRQHEILPDHCRLYREEGYMLNLHGYTVRFQEIDAVRSDHIDSVREWYEVSVGSGLYVDVELKRRLPAHTILISRSIFSFLKMSLKRNMYKYQDVGLVSPRFSKRFMVLSTDQIEARMAFHPAFIEKFMEIADHLNTNHIEASFLRDKLLIHARYKKDLFQIGHFWRPLNLHDLEFLIHELNLYGDIIETLKFNPYTAP